MKVAFDCYKALGITPQATPQELQQGYSDRLQSIPHREYSERALQQRNELLQVAMGAITDDEQAGYGQSVLEVDHDRFAGLLLLLLELGEYQQVLELGCPLFERGQERNGHSLFQADILLSIGRAYLEIGRELRQQVQYEQGAQTLEIAQELLLREGGSISLRSEIQRELYLMRPYRILELLSAPDNHITERQCGIGLLEDLINDRLGIDGNGNDRSELKKHDFLGFLQQVRTYLTATEQQQLFEQEARRPSAIASFLAAYALIAEGFASHQPSLIRRAKGLLIKIGHWQDLYLEQSLCCLLLGQAETALSLVERSSNHREISDMDGQDEDLLAGLCRYCEKWLKEDVYPYFRDLQHKTKNISLKIYFADPQVQTYLDELGSDEEVPQEWVRSPYPSYRPTHPPNLPKPSPKTRPQRNARQPKFNLPIVFLSIALISLGSALWIGRSLLFRETETTTISTDPPPAISTPTPTPLVGMDRQVALTIIETWQTAKAQARSNTYDTSALAAILTEPELSQWRQSIADLQQEDTYYEYTLHNITIKDLKEISPANFTITAEITESRTVRRKGEIIPIDSLQNVQYQVNYEIVRENDRWLIRKMEALSP